MLEGAEQGLAQVDTAVEQINTQLEGMMEQKEEMITAVAELKDLLGLDEEATDEEDEEAEDNGE